MHDIGGYAAELPSLIAEATRWEGRNVLLLWLAGSATLVATAIAFCIAVATYKGGLANARLRGAQERNNELQLAKVRADAEERIVAVETESNKRIEEARAQAAVQIAEATRIASVANERAEELSKSNLVLRADVANLEKDAAEAKRKYLELFDRLKPRMFKAAQQDNFLARIKNLPKLIIDEVAWVKDDLESRDFARQIGDLLNEAGWEVKVVRHVLFMRKIGAPPPVGVAVAVKDVSKIPPEVEELRLAFGKSSGMVLEIESRPDLAEGHIAITVGAKP